MDDAILGMPNFTAPGALHVSGGMHVPQVEAVPELRLVGRFTVPAERWEAEARRIVRELGLDPATVTLRVSHTPRH